VSALVGFCCFIAIYSLSYFVGKKICGPDFDGIRSLFGCVMATVGFLTILWAICLTYGIYHVSTVLGTWILNSFS
jgi:hypothetical protein